jgi:hypothetical protein
MNNKNAPFGVSTDQFRPVLQEVQNRLRAAEVARRDDDPASLAELIDAATWCQLIARQYDLLVELEEFAERVGDGFFGGPPSSDRVPNV